MPEYDGDDDNDLAKRAGVVATRMLADRGLIYIEDLDATSSRELLRAAWHEAARDMFAGKDVPELHAEIDSMIDSLNLDPPTSAPLGVPIH